MENRKQRQEYEDSWNLDVDYLIEDSPNKYIVFIDEELDVDWKTSDEFENNGITNKDRHYYILSKAAKVECIPNHHLHKKNRHHFKRMIGEAIARSFAGEYDNADEMLEKACEYIVSRNSEIAKYWYVLASVVTGLIFIVLGTTYWLMRRLFIEHMGITGYFLILSGFGGGAGALLSIFLRIGKANFDSAAGKNIHFLEGFLRILTGSISGVLLALFIRLGLILSISNHNTYITMFTFSIVAGASERWVPSIISQLENNNISTMCEGDAIDVETYPHNF